jgi:hypothetical protein
VPRTYRIIYSKDGEVLTAKLKSYSRNHAKQAFTVYHPTAVVLRVEDEGGGGSLRNRNVPIRRQQIRDRLIAGRLENLRRASDE